MTGKNENINETMVDYSSPLISVKRVDSDFRSWAEVLRLLHASFKFQKSRIDPPSSLYRLDEHSLSKKAETEQLIVAQKADSIVGCVFAKTLTDRIYVGKMAVAPAFQGNGVGRMLMNAVEHLAFEQHYDLLELQVRVELVENHKAFGKLGFVKVAETAHDGYDRPTSITMQKRLKG